MRNVDSGNFEDLEKINKETEQDKKEIKKNRSIKNPIDINQLINNANMEDGDKDIPTFIRIIQENQKINKKDD